MAAEIRNNGCYDVYKPMIPDQASLKRIARDWAEVMGDVSNSHKARIVDLGSRLGHTLLEKIEPAIGK